MTTPGTGSTSVDRPVRALLLGRNEGRFERNYRLLSVVALAGSAVGAYAVGPFGVADTVLVVSGDATLVGLVDLVVALAFGVGALTRRVVSVVGDACFSHGCERRLCSTGSLVRVSSVPRRDYTDSCVTSDGRDRCAHVSSVESTVVLLPVCRRYHTADWL